MRSVWYASLGIYSYGWSSWSLTPFIQCVSMVNTADCLFERYVLQVIHEARPGTRLDARPVLA